VPLRPTQGGREGNESGNPYLNANKVLSLWRASVSRELREKWFVIDPAPQDRVSWETAQQATEAEKNAELAEASAEADVEVSTELID
jgi:hypothetical protein